MRRIALALWLGLLPGAAFAGPPSPPAPERLPPPRDPGTASLLDDREDWPRVPLGAGWLGPARPGPGLGTSWMEEVTLAFYSEPGGEAAGWIARGWRIAATCGARPEPLPADCFVETHYETASLVVHEIKEDGWFRIDLQPPCDGSDAVWAHRSQLPATVRLRSWEERFQSDTVSALRFRDREQRYALRTEPDPGSGRITWISAADTFEPLEIRGDWMRVLLAQPSKYCQDPATWKGRLLEGWLRWRDPAKGPWIWVFPRGC